MSTILCSECNSTEIRIDHHGYYVCSECGLVTDEPVLQSHLPSIKTGMNGEILHSHGVVIDAGTTLGVAGERIGQYNHLARVQRMVLQSPITISYSIFAQLKATFDVTIASNIFVSSFRKFYAKLPKCTK